MELESPVVFACMARAFTATVFLLVVARAAAALALTRPCSTDTQCAAYHLGVCATAMVSGAPGGCVCAAGRGWHALLRACVPFETGTTVVVGTTNALVYTDLVDGRFAAPLRWPDTWTCDELQCRATERGVLYATWRRDLIQLASVDAAQTVVLAPSDVFMRCATGQVYLRTAASQGASATAASDVPAYAHCTTCVGWCGAHAVSCAGDGTPMLNPATGFTAPFQCTCAPGWDGVRCNVQRSSAQSESLMRNLQPGSHVMLSSLDTLSSIDSTVVTVFATLTFPVYDTTRPCTTNADCDADTEACYISVPASQSAARIIRACFCRATGALVPSTTARTGCVPAPRGSTTIFGVVDATASANARTGATTVIPIVLSGDAANSADGTGATATDLTSVPSETLLTTGFLLVSSTRLATVNATYITIANATNTTWDDVVISLAPTAPQRLGSGTMDTISAAYARTSPLWVRCATDPVTGARRAESDPTGSPGGTFRPLVEGQVSAAQWCAPSCIGPSACDPVGTSDCSLDTGTCNCAPGFKGPQCDVLNETAHDCALRRCGAHGYCVGVARTTADATCACQPEWTGPTCGESAFACAQANCSAGAGVCTDTPGVCHCATDGDSVGADCSITTRACGAVLCNARGICAVGDLHCICDAPNAWSGPDCGTRVCANGGTASGDVCVCAPGWTGDNCDVSVCAPADEPWRGHWDPAAGHCACGAVWHLNVSSATPYQCESHLCGPEAEPVEADYCDCSSTQTMRTEFMAFDTVQSGATRCRPLPPQRITPVAWSVDAAGGARLSYAERDAIFSVLPVVLPVLVGAAVIGGPTIVRIWARVARGVGDLVARGLRALRSRAPARRGASFREFRLPWVK